MRRYFLISLGFFLLLQSCEKKTQQEEKKQPKTAMSKSINHKKIIKLTSYTTEKIKNWKAYNELSDFLQRFESISPNETLNSAVELKDLTTKIKGNIPNNILKTPSFRSRLNVLENECLRLVDMAKIPAIKANEVNKQTAKTLLIFSSINAKLNAVFAAQKIDEGVDLSNFFKLDSADKRNKNPH